MPHFGMQRSTFSLLFNLLYRPRIPDPAPQSVGTLNQKWTPSDEACWTRWRAIYPAANTYHRTPTCHLTRRARRAWIHRYCVLCVVPDSKFPVLAPGSLVRRQEPRTQSWNQEPGTRNPEGLLLSAMNSLGPDR